MPWRLRVVAPATAHSIQPLHRITALSITTPTSAERFSQFLQAQQRIHRIEMKSMDVERTIEKWTDDFIENSKKPFKDLSKYSTEGLNWLMAEHFQFSNRNTKLLWSSAQTVGAFENDAVKNELIRNYKEELDHAAMYKAALLKVSVDVDTRQVFEPTESFLEKLAVLCDRDPSSVLGTMYATESAAIFEHEVFREVSKEVIARGNHGSNGKPLMDFHDLHLGGVEQSHRDELGIFLRDAQPDQDIYPGDSNRPSIKPKQALQGGKEAVDTMIQWWNHLFATLNEKSNIPVAVV